MFEYFSQRTRYLNISSVTLFFLHHREIQFVHLSSISEYFQHHFTSVSNVFKFEIPQSSLTKQKVNLFNPVDRIFLMLLVVLIALRICSLLFLEINVVLSPVFTLLKCQFFKSVEEKAENISTPNGDMFRNCLPNLIFMASELLSTQTNCKETNV